MVSDNWKQICQAQLHKKSNNDKSSITKEDVWFEVKDEDLQRSKITETRKPLDLFTKNSNKDLHELGKFLALDCEMVGIGPEGKDSALARVCLVNWHGHVIYDSFVKPSLPVTDYRTAISGCTPQLLKDAPEFSTVQAQVSDLISGKVLIGHALKNDLRVLMLGHPRKFMRDTSKYRVFRRLSRGKNPALRMLAQHYLGLLIQKGEHDPADDARVAMLLYRKFKDDWENYLFRQDGKLLNAQSRARRKERATKSGNKS